MAKKRPVSPVNGQPLPEGRPNWEAGEEAREMGRKGGKRSGEVRRQRKTLRNELLELLAGDVTDKNGNTKQAQSVLTMALLKSAISGNVRAFEVIRDTIGEKPVEKVDVQAADFTALDEAFRAMKGK